MSEHAMNFEEWYRENEAYLVTQPFTNYVAAAAWQAGRIAERERCAAYLLKAASVARRAGAEKNARMLENHAAMLANTD